MSLASDIGESGYCCCSKKTEHRDLSRPLISESREAELSQVRHSQAADESEATQSLIETQPAVVQTASVEPSSTVPKAVQDVAELNVPDIRTLLHEDSRANKSFEAKDVAPIATVTMSLDEARVLQQAAVAPIETVTMSLDEARVVQQAAAEDRAKREEEEEEEEGKVDALNSEAEQSRKQALAEKEAGANAQTDNEKEAEEPDHRALKMIRRAKAHARGGADLIFLIHRSNNTNCVCYKGNAAKGVEVLWIMFEKKGEPTEGLTFAEKKTAYGFTCKPSSNVWTLKMKALSDRAIAVVCEDGVWSARTRIGDNPDEILRAVHVEMKKQLIPAVKHIEIFGANGAYELKKP
jgi:hypothetical protein